MHRLLSLLSSCLVLSRFVSLRSAMGYGHVGVWKLVSGEWIVGWGVLNKVCGIRIRMGRCDWMFVVRRRRWRWMNGFRVGFGGKERVEIVWLSSWGLDCRFWWVRWEGEDWGEMGEGEMGWRRRMNGCILGIGYCEFALWILFIGLMGLQRDWEIHSDRRVWNHSQWRTFHLPIHLSLEHIVISTSKIQASPDPSLPPQNTALKPSNRDEPVRKYRSR